MKKPYNSRAGFAQRLRHLGLTAALVSGVAAVAQAQNLSYPVAQASNSAGTYTDLGTTGTVITTANNDDANLVALCQRCHVNHDRPEHRRRRWRTLFRRRADGDLFG